MIVIKYFHAKYFDPRFGSNNKGQKSRYLLMKPDIIYILISYMEPPTILIFIFTLNKAQYLIWIYNVTYYEISADLSWVDRYYQVVFTNGSNTYIATYYPYRLYRHSSSFNKSSRCLIWITWVNSTVY